MPELRIYDHATTDLLEAKKPDDLTIKRRDVFSVQVEASDFTFLSTWIAEQSAIAHTTIGKLLPFDCIDFQGAKLEEIPALLGFVETNEMQALKAEILQDLQEEKEKADAEKREMRPVQSLIDYHEIFEQEFPLIEQKARIGKSIAQALMLKDVGDPMGFYNEMMGTDDEPGIIYELTQIGFPELANILCNLVNQLMDEFYPS